MRKRRAGPVIYIVCVLLAVLSLIPFWIMIVNATRSTYQIQQHAVSLLPSTHLLENLKVLTGKTFNPWTGFLNSVIISTGSTVLSIYFSTLTAYALIAYTWKLRQPFFTLIMAVMMIPTQVISIGFYQFMYRMKMTNNLLALILPNDRRAHDGVLHAAVHDSGAEPRHRRVGEDRRRGRVSHIQQHRPADHEAGDGHAGDLYVRHQLE